MDNESLQYLLVAIFFIIIFGRIIYKYKHKKKNTHKPPFSMCDNCCEKCALFNSPKNKDDIQCNSDKKINSPIT